MAHSAATEEVAVSSEPVSVPGSRTAPAHRGRVPRARRDRTGYDELVEGRVVMSPSPVPDHNHAAFQTAVQLRAAAAADLEVLLDLDVDLELAPPDAPGFTRRPDLIVVRRSARERVRREGGIIRAAEVVVVAELVSPGSRRTDHVRQTGRLRRRGHPALLDRRPRRTGVADRLPSRRASWATSTAARAAGVFTTTEPFPVRLDLGARWR